MNDDYWFTLFRGRGTYKLQPRGAKGWAATIGMVLLVIALIIPLSIAASHRDNPALAVLPILVIAPLVIGFVLLARRKAFVIDLRTIEADMRELAQRRAADHTGRPWQSESPRQ